MMTLLLQQLRNIGHFCKDTESHLHNPLLANRCLLVLGIGFSFLFCSGIVLGIGFSYPLCSGLVSLFFLQAQRTLQQQECLDSEFFSLICHLAMFFATLLGGEQEVVTFSFQLQVISEHRDFEKFTDLPGEASPSPNFTYIKVFKNSKELKRQTNVFA